MSRLLALSALLALAITACGGDDAGTSPSDTSTATPSVPPPTLPPDAPVPVHLYSGELHLQPADGGPSTKIASYPGWFMDSAWSPLGDFAISVYLSPYRTELHVFDHESFNDRFAAVLDGATEDLIWSPDGARIAFHTSDPASGSRRLAILRRWDSVLATPSPPAGVTGDSRPVGWLSNDRLLAIYGQSALVEHDVVSQSSRLVVDLGFPIGSPAISPDGSHFLIPTCVPGVNDFPLVVNIETGERRVLTPLPCNILAAAWSPGGDRLAYGVTDDGSGRGGLYAVDAVGGEPRQLLDAGYALSVEWSPDARSIIALTSGCYACDAPGVWLNVIDFETGAHREPIPALDVGLSPDKQRAAYVPSNRGVAIQDLATGSEHLVVEPQPEVSFGLAGWRFGTDSFLVTRGVATNHESDFALNIDGTGFEPYPWPPGADQVFPTADQTRLAIIETDGEQRHEPGRLSVFDVSTGARREIPLPHVFYVNWALDGRHLLATANLSQEISAETRLFLVDTESGSVTPLDIDPYNGVAAWSRDSRAVAFGGEYDDPGISVLDIQTLEVTTVPPELFVGASQWGTQIYYLDWSPDGGRMVFSSDGDIQVINADGSGIRRLTTDPANEFDPRFSPDGRLIAFRRAVGNTVNIVVMDIESGQARTIYSPPADFGGDRLAWSPDGKRLAFTAGTLQGQGVFIINNDGTGHYQLTAGTIGVVDLYWLTNDRITLRLAPTNVM